MKSALVYREAVDFAVAYLRRQGIESAREDMLKQLRFRFAIRTGYAFIDYDGNRALPTEDDGHSIEELFQVLEASPENKSETCYRFAFTGESTEAVDRLIELSRNSSIAFDALVDVAASMARHGLPYQGQLQEWVADYLGGCIKRTARKGRIRAETLWRDLLIVGAVTELVELGLAATRNDVSAQTSACDAVAEACRSIGISPGSFQSIKRIWNNSERVLRYF